MCHVCGFFFVAAEAEAEEEEGKGSGHICSRLGPHLRERVDRRRPRGAVLVPLERV